MEELLTTDLQTIHITLPNGSKAELRFQDNTMLFTADLLSNGKWAYIETVKAADNAVLISIV